MLMCCIILLICVRCIIILTKMALHKMADAEGDCKLFVSQDLKTFCALMEVSCRPIDRPRHPSLFTYCKLVV